ncbi:hypothetical protein CH306_26330 [Rhodococcus sp. 15-725-2-2b]|uniref:HpcH/HpaI aldolase/citrate lyase family protein n=1 Tax=unclassified Rhodococcus (in: high G+C Gram-positive bacteria) TaxID=192944 RepID=UPI000B9A4567|nr:MULTISPECIES: CoA ester lyase [unclassified Rhodococcus (in: high G+C Gram-positive bacteria)]OZC63595.1 hypothetical protein CH277_22330 [Rhodococcus sp. 06-469-3-2]OZD40760.1 hypothetical protein CH264_24015 [Rhodococcus sp. 06-1477-1A]OZE67132.1 hypothetical protein CH306_26330 [Rhodococcus sp. 15-725-2-2b]
MITSDYRDVVRAARSFLFVPGDRPERFAKAAVSGADVIVFDLEDSVDATDKNSARLAVSQWLRAGHQGIVRINAADTEWYRDDVLSVVGMHATGVMVPKASDPIKIASLRASLHWNIAFVSLVETSAGVASASAISAVPGTTRTAFGSIDLAAELDVSPDDRECMAFARGALVIAAAAAALPGPIDGVTTAIHDKATITSDTQYAKRLGLTAKMCIHPHQIPIVHDALSPTRDDLEWAKGILDRVRRGNSSAVAVGGHMVDAPVIKRARRILGYAQLQPSVKESPGEKAVGKR